MSSTTSERVRDGANDATRPRSKRRTRRFRLALMIGVPLLLVVAGAWWYLTSGRYVGTDDAYVQADIVTLSSDVSGRVVAVEVHDNEHVRAGQTLFRLDDRPFRAALDNAEGQLANTRLQVESLRATYRQHLAELTAAQKTLDFQQREYERQRQLLQTSATPRATFEQAETSLAQAQQQVASIEQQIAGVVANLGGNPDIPTDQHPLVQQAQAQVDQAKLNLGYTVVSAPANGIVANVDKLPVGNYLAASAPAFSLVETDHPWIAANFKETQLTHMRVGDPATVSVDAYPGTIFRGRVVSLSPGTGSEFSVLPPQNATGNWVKVVQRLPVRVEVDDIPAQPLRIGMSCYVDVDTGYVSSLVRMLRSIF